MWLTAVCHKHGSVGLCRSLLRWRVGEDVEGAIVGARKPGQIKETVFGGKFAIKPEDLARIDEALAVRG